MSMFDRAIEGLMNMQRALRWATLAALGLVVFLIWSELVQPIAAELNVKADRIENNVREIRSVERDIRTLNAKQGLVTAIGPVRAPATVAEGLNQFNEVVLDVLQKNGAVNANFSSRSRGKLPKSALTSVTSPGERIDRLVGDVKFDATPRSAVAIISQLESSPYVEAINGVRIVKDTGGKVKVTLTIEAWLRTKEQGATS
jgi:hypothetical protein